MKGESHGGYDYLLAFCCGLPEVVGERVKETSDGGYGLLLASIGRIWKGLLTEPRQCVNKGGYGYLFAYRRDLPQIASQERKDTNNFGYDHKLASCGVRWKVARERMKEMSDSVNGLLLLSFREVREGLRTEPQPCGYR
jgi:hypothetical protein